MDKRREYRWLNLPYGIHLLPDGRELLFNRDYVIICERNTHYYYQCNYKLEEKAITDFYANGMKTVFFYDDGTPEKLKYDIGFDALRRFKSWRKMAA